MKLNAILVVGTHHIHVCELQMGVAHIAWSGRVACPVTSGAYGVGPDPQSINGDEPWINEASEVIGSITDDCELADCAIRPRLEAVGVPLIK